MTATCHLARCCRATTSTRASSSPSTAVPEAIEIAWRALLKRHHPDVAGADADDVAKRINVAHDWLSDPALRERTTASGIRAVVGAAARRISVAERDGPSRAAPPRPRPPADPAEALARHLARIGRLTQDELDRLALAESPPIAFVATIARFLSPDRLAAVEAVERRVAAALPAASRWDAPTRDAIVAYAHELILGPFLDEHLSEPFRERVRERLARGWEAAVDQPRYGPNTAAVSAALERLRAMPPGQRAQLVVERGRAARLVAGRPSRRPAVAGRPLRPGRRRAAGLVVARPARCGGDHRRSGARASPDARSLGRCTASSSATPSSRPSSTASSGRGARCCSSARPPLGRRPGRARELRSERPFAPDRCVEYNLSLVFDGRSGQRPGPKPLIPIHTIALTGPRRTTREGPQELMLPMSFDTLGLAPELLRAVADQGYTEPTPVQAEAIPLVLAGRDLLAGAQTGTGKTAAFVLPILQRLTDSHARRRGRARPAIRRERDPAPGPRPRPDPDARARPPGRGELPHLRRPPPRPLDRDLRRRRLRAPGPGPPRRPGDRRRHPRPPARPRRPADDRPVARSRSSSSTRPTGCSTWASSATSARSSTSSRRAARTCCSRRRSRTRSGASPAVSSIARPPSRSRRATRATALVTQLVLPVDRERKRELLSHLIQSGRVEQALVFTRTKHGANRLAEQLARDGIAATAIHGNKSQGQRVRALDDFKAGRASILVATEVASRGLDIEELPHVVNYELPMVAEDYVHRIGRTGRAGSTGDAISLVCVDEWPLLREIESLLGNRDPDRGDPGLRARSLDPAGADPPALAGRPGPPDGRPATAAAADRTSPRGDRTSPPAGPIRVAPARSGTRIARARPVGRRAGAPSHPGHGGPRRGPADVGIGNAPGGFRGAAPAARPPAAGPTRPPAAGRARSRTVGGQPRSRSSIVRIARPSCRANASPATARADRATDRRSAGCHTAAGTATMAGARGKPWTPGSCSSRMTRRSAR